MNLPSDGSPSSVRVGLLGCGHVGAALVALVAERRPEIARRRALDLEVVRIAVRNTAIDRDVPVSGDSFTTDAASVVSDPDVDVIVEVMGGIEPARELVSTALAAGKPVVTANKDLLANHGAELYALAEANGVDLLFEAAVAGAIPIMRPLRESLAGEPINRVMGIVNGTTNFILSRMAADGASYVDALVEAQNLGYAESDPTADVEGYDAGAKVAVIATVAFGAMVVAGDVYHEGISGITQADIELAADLQHCIKLLAVAERTVADDGEPQIGVRVHPTLVPLDHPLASVNGSFNAVFVESAAAGDLMLYGRGAGGRPTASAVLGDLIDASANMARGHGATIGTLEQVRIAPIDDVVSAFYLNIEVDDRPGVLASVATVFGEHGVSIRSMEQEGLGGEARLVFITHGARERDLRATIDELRSLEAVRAVGSVLRVIGD